MKKIISMILTVMVILSLSVTYAAGADTTNASSTPQTTAPGTATVLEANTEYTVAKLQEIALNNSRQKLIDDMDIKKKEMAVRTVRTDSRAMSDSILSVTKPLDVQLELEAAQRIRQDHMNQLRIDVYKAAMSIQLCEKEIRLQEQKLVIAEEQLTMAKARYKAATITQDELDSAQYNVDSKKVDLTNVKEKIDSLFLELKKLLNQPLDIKPVKIAGVLKQESFEAVDTEAILTGLYKTDTSMFKASGKLDIDKKAMEIAGKLYRKGDLYYDEAALDLEEEELNFSAAKTSLEVKVKNTYNEMANSLDNMELANKYVVLTAKKLENIKIKYDKGTISKDSYMQAKEALLNAEYKELAAIVEYNGMKAEFSNIIGAK